MQAWHWHNHVGGFACSGFCRSSGRKRDCIVPVEIVSNEEIVYATKGNADRLRNPSLESLPLAQYANLYKLDGFLAWEGFTSAGMENRNSELRYILLFNGSCVCNRFSNMGLYNGVEFQCACLYIIHIASRFETY